MNKILEVVGEAELQVLDKGVGKGTNLAVSVWIL